MARYVASVETSWEREEAFAYLAEFSHVSEWDPGVSRARTLSGAPLEAGARFEVVSAFLGREQELIYETIEIEAPHRVLLRAEMSAAVSLDEMTFDLRPGGGTVVTYDADLRLKGAMRALELPFRLVFQRLGDKAKRGLHERLALPAPVPSKASA